MIKRIEEKKALEKLIKENFCDLQTVVGCCYYQKTWCPKTCGFYTRKMNDTLNQDKLGDYK